MTERRECPTLRHSIDLAMLRREFDRIVTEPSRTHGSRFTHGVFVLVEDRYLMDFLRQVLDMMHATGNLQEQGGGDA